MITRRGDIWLVDFGDPIGHEEAGQRPAIVVSDDAMNDGPSGLVIVIPVTTAHRGLPSHIEIDDPASGLNQVSYAKCEDIKSISTRRLIVHLGKVSLDASAQIDRVLRYLLHI